MSTGTCTVHSYNDGVEGDESGLGSGRRLNAVLDDQDYGEQFPTTQSDRRSRQTRAQSNRRSGLLSRLVSRGDEEDEDGAW